MFVGSAHAFPIEQDEEEPQQLEEVVIWGSADGSSGWEPWASNGSGSRYSDTQLQNDSPEATVANFNSRTQDARCNSDTDVRNSSTNSDKVTRNYVADKMYQAYAAQIGRLPVGAKFHVVYGDGGSEVWLVGRSSPIGPTGSNMGEPVAGSLQPAGTYATPSAAECSQTAY
jgi:hypothetical protein